MTTYPLARTDVVLHLLAEHLFTYGRAPGADDGFFMEQACCDAPDLAWSAPVSVLSLVVEALSVLGGAAVESQGLDGHQLVGVMGLFEHFDLADVVAHVEEDSEEAEDLRMLATASADQRLEFFSRQYLELF